MQVKGTGIKTTKEFVLENFPDDYDGWIESLSIESKPYFVETADFTRWYPIKEAYIDPGNKIIELFYQGDIKAGAEALGRFSANYALKGIYKVFLLIASPKHLIKRAQKIMVTYFQPCEISIVQKSNKSFILVISKFDLISTTIEYRIAGWCQRALELTNCKNVQYNIRKSLTIDDKVTEIEFYWD